MPWAHTSLEDIRSELGAVAEEHDWERYHAPSNLAAALHGEVRNLQQHVQAGGDGWGAEGYLASILAYTVRLSDKLGVDLGMAMQQALGTPRGARANGSVDRGSPAQQAARKHLPPGVTPLVKPDTEATDAAQNKREKERPRSLDTALQNGEQGDGKVQSKRPAFKRTLSVVCDQVSLPKPSDLYSPSHFTHDLFSPVSDKKDFEIDYDVNRPVLPQSLSKGNLDQSPAPAAEPSSPQILSPRSLDNFYAFVDEGELEKWADEDLRSLDLRFCAPLEGRIVPLCTDGETIPVTAANVPEFLRLARALRELRQRFVPQPLRMQLFTGPVPVPAAAVAATPPPAASESPAPASGSARRTLKRTLSVATGVQDNSPEPQACFSPTHYEHDLFSPTTRQTDFEIEYSQEGAAHCLPKSLSKGNGMYAG